MLKLLIGRARTGKSERILREIARQGDAGRQILLVPEHASHVAEVDVCRACGDGASRHAEVLTFKLLSSRVLALTGGSADVTLDNGGKLLTLHAALQELAPSLRVYGRPSQRPAFLESLLDVIEELQAYAVSPEKLSASVAELEGESGDKLRDVALLYGVYLAKLHAPGRDARDRLEKLEEQLEQSGYVDGKDVYIDGFSYFTGRESNIVRIMLRRASNVTVTLLGDGSDPELFRESLRFRERLIALADEAGVAWKESVLKPRKAKTALDHVERCFFSEKEAWTGPVGRVHLFESATACSECERTAAEILRLVRSGKYRYRDITVTARDLSTYAPVLETVFARYGIPLYTARRSDILRSNVMTLLLGALDAACGGFEYEDVFRCLKSGLAGLTAEECDVLENYALKWDVHGTMWTRETPWTAHPDGYGEAWTDASRARLDTVNELRERVRGPFALLYEGVRGTAGVEQKVRALYEYLERVGLAQALEERTARLFAAGEGRRAEETAQLWSILCGVMDQFVSILGGRELEAEEFARLMRLVLTQYSVGTIPASLDQVNCAEMTRNDRHSVKALFLLGANDGALPRLEDRAGVLREEDRMALERCDIRLAPYAMAQFHLEIQNLYAALAQPTQELFLSYPRFDGAGAELRPSFVIGRLRAILPGVEVEKESADRDPRLSALRPALEYAGEHIDGKAWQWFERRGDVSARLEGMRAASRYTRGKLSREVVRTLYGERITLSASRMDKARSCHFAYFMQYGLRAKERGSAQFDAPQIGTFLHDVLENTLRRAEEEGGLKSVDRRRLHALVRQSIEAYVERELPDLEEKSARFRYLFRRLGESAQRIMDEVADELLVSDFVPLAFELSFGPKGDLPAITLRDGDRTVNVVGQADRVDGWMQDGKLYLRVADYKTGRKSFDLADVRYGLGIQMLLYLFALEREGKERFGAREIIPAGVLYTPARDTVIDMARSADDDAIAAKMKKNLRRSGLLLSDARVLEAMEHSALTEPCYLPLSAKRTADGTVDLTGSLASGAQLGQLSRYVDHLLREISREIAQGNVDADPCARSVQDTACTYCPFAPACHFEPGHGSDRLQYIRPAKPEEFWDYVKEKAAEEAKYHG